MLTALDFYRYLQCPHWPYWERFGNPEERRPLTAEQERRLADGLDRKYEIAAEMYPGLVSVDNDDATLGSVRALELMRQGVPAIYQGWLQDADWNARPDILERQEGESALGSWYYVPVDIKRAHELKKEHVFPLLFASVLLEKVQGYFPPHPGLINADHERLSCEPQTYMTEFRDVVLKLERVIAGECPEPVYRKSCQDTSPWGQACFRLAKEHDDIALLFNVDMAKLRFLREHGLRTIYDAADMDTAQLEGLEPGMTVRALQAIQRQARSLVDHSVIIKKPWLHETVGLEIHFDIESHPMTDADYLYGFLLKSGEEARSVSFLAERPDDERIMWRQFLDWLPSLPAEYTVYHYASYEAERLQILAKRYGDLEQSSLKHFRTRLVDLKEVAREHAVYPLYFYSLKTIGSFLGFAWTSEVKSGSASITAYEQWLASGDRCILEDIVRYNADDERATAHLLAWLRRYARAEAVYTEPYPWQGEA